MSLLEDPSEAVYTDVRNSILSYGELVFPYLNEFEFSACGNNISSERVAEIRLEITFRNVVKQIEHWSKEPDKDLLNGWYLLSKMQYPELSKEKIFQKYNVVFQKVWLEVSPKQTSIELFGVLRCVLIDLIGFEISPVTGTHDVSLNNLPAIFDTKFCSELSFCILSSLIAQDLNIPLYVYQMPSDRILLGMMDSNQVMKVIQGELNAGGVLCFFDPKHDFEIVSVEEVLKTEFLNCKSSDINKVIHPASNSDLLKYLIFQNISLLSNDSRNMKKNMRQQYLKLLAHI